MKRASLVCLFLPLATTFLLSQSNPVSSIDQSARVVSPRISSIGASEPDAKARARVSGQYGKLPLSFEANHGQTDSSVKFFSRTGGYSLFLTWDEAVLTLRGGLKKPAPKGASGLDARLRSVERVASTAPTSAVLRMKLRNANPAATVTGVDELAGTSNYFVGNDPAKWRTKVPTYAKVKYEGIYSGIDLVYYGNQRQLEYDFIVAPGADPRRIAFDVSGAKRIRKDEHGDLVFKVGEGEIRWHKPVAYQEKDGARQLVAARYAVTDTNRVGFEVAAYDAARPLYIDPLIYSTYLGGSSLEFGPGGIAVDSAGSAYVTGTTGSTDFPTTPGAFQTEPGGGFNIFVTKINAAGSGLVYSTYIGGAIGGSGIAVDREGNAYVTGVADSPYFPVTPGAFQTKFGGGFDSFVTKLNPAGSALVYSTFLGGSGTDEGTGIAVDSAGNAHVTGWTVSTDFPTKNPLQPALSGAYDAFVAEFDPAGVALYSTYLGGSAIDAGLGIAVDSSGNAYVTGNTGSTDFPVTPGAFETAGGGAFVAKINPAGSALVYSTYLNDAGGTGIAVDGAGNAYVTGSAASSFPTTPGAFQTTYGGGDADAFVAKLNSAGSALVYSTYLGGKGSESGSGIVVDSAGNAYVTGGTDNSGSFPKMNPLLVTNGRRDAFVAELNPAGSALVYSTPLGGKLDDSGDGIAVDSAGAAYVSGTTISPDFPTSPGAFQTVCNLGDNCWEGDFFAAKILYAASTTGLISSVNPSVSGKPVTFTATVSSPSGGAPTGKVTFWNGATVLGKATLSGGTASLTTSKLPPGLNSITAVYGGDSNFTGSTSAPVNQLVLAVTTTDLSSAPNPSTQGQAVTFTAVVTSGVGAPPDGETVSFMKGKTVLGMGTLSGGTAGFTTSTLKVGTTVVKAVYAGDSNLLGSKSKAVKQVVKMAGE